MSSTAFGTEVFLIQEAVAEATTTEILKSSFPYQRTVPFAKIKDLVETRVASGYQFWAFGSSYEETVFEIEVHDLQKQNKWLITRAEDHGIQHDAHSETDHYHNMILKNWSPEELTWHDARTDPDKMARYNELLRQKGYPPIIHKDSFMKYNHKTVAVKAIDFSLAKNQDDIHVLKNLLYREICTRNVGRREFEILCCLARKSMDPKLASEFDQISYSDYPFPPEVTETDSLYYLRDMESQQYVYLQQQYPDLEQKVMEVTRAKIGIDGEAKRKERLARADIARLNHGDTSTLKTIGPDYDGEEDKVKWSVAFNGFFGRLNRQVTAAIHDPMNADPDREFELIKQRFKDHQSFFFKKWKIIPYQTRCYLAKKVPNCPEEETFSGRKNKAPKLKRDCCEVTYEELGEALSKEFPPRGEHITYNDHGVMTLYRLDISYLQKQNLLFSLPGGTVRFLSQSDEYCGWKALACMAYQEPQFHHAAEMSLAQAKLAAAEGKKGHSFTVLKQVGKRLGVNVMTLTDIHHQITLTKPEHLKNKVNQYGHPLLPCVVLQSGHASLAFDDFSKKPFSYRQLSKAFQEVSMMDPLKTDVTRCTNNKEIMKKKDSMAYSKASRRQAVLTHEDHSKKILINRNKTKCPEAVMNYTIRQILNMDQTKLPLTHASDAEVSLFIVDWQLRLHRSTIIPTPMSQRAYKHMASLQKKKHPNIFQKDAIRQVQTYSLRKDITSGIISTSEEVPKDQPSKETRESQKQDYIKFYDEPGGQLQDEVFEGRSAQHMYNELNEQNQRIQTDNSRRRLPKERVSKAQTIQLSFETEQSDLEKLKQIDSRAHKQGKSSLLLSTYCGNNPSSIMNKESEMNFNPFYTAPCYMKNGILTPGKVQVNIQGATSGAFWDWINLYGHNLHRNANKVAAHTSGGHPCLRTMVNLFIAQQIEAILERCLRRRNPDNGRKQRIICPGDKFAKTTSILNSSLKWNSWIAYPDLGPNATEAEKQNQVAQKAVWDLAADRIREDQNLTTNYERNQAFCNRLDQIRNFPPHIVNQFRQRPEIIHTSVRPEDNSYDNCYYSNNYENVMNDPWQPGYVDHEYIRGYIEQNDTVYENDDVIYWLSDVHYYLSGWRPSNRKDGDYYTCVGANFFHIPGRYLLPFNEGEYYVTGDGEIKMITRGSDLFYSHPHVLLCNTDRVINMGWYSLAISHGNPRDFKIFRYDKTGFNSMHSLQTNFLQNALEDIKTTVTAQIALKDLFPAYTEDDATDFIYSLSRQPQYMDLTTLGSLQIFSYFKIPPTIRQCQMESVPIHRYRHFFFGPKLRERKIEHISPNHPDYHHKFDKKEYRDILRQEIEDPRNERGLFSKVFKPFAEVPVPYLNTRESRTYWNRSRTRIGEYFLGEEKAMPDLVNKLALHDSYQTTMIYCGRAEREKVVAIPLEAIFEVDEKQETDSKKMRIKEAPRGQQLLNEISYGTDSSNYKQVMEDYRAEILNRMPKKQKSIFSPTANSDVTIEMKGYYMHKKPDIESFDDHNPYVIVDPINYYQQVGRLCDYWKSQTEIMAIKKDKMVPVAQVIDGKVVTKSGSMIIDEATGKPIQEFEWSSKSFPNLIWSLQRHISPRQMPENIHLRAFDDFSERCLTHICGNIMSEDPQPQYLMMDYPASQKQWSQCKIGKYEGNIHEAYYNPKYQDYIASFQLMVKSGEVYTTKDRIKDTLGHLLYQKSRPRAIMNPTKKAYGIMHAMQREIWPLLKKHFPGFIHSMTAKEIVAMVRKRICPLWLSICIDGSAFDSSQFAQLMRSVDDKFWTKIQPFVQKIIEKNWASFHVTPRVTPEMMTRSLMASLLQTRNTVFIKVPGVQAPDWPSEIRDQFFRDMDEAKKWTNKRVEDDWIYIELEGTTFSGHSTKTTLGNTIRSLMYAWYYQMVAGISDTPWDSNVVFTIASGDDVVMWIRPDLMPQLRDTIMRLTARDTTSQ